MRSVVVPRAAEDGECLWGYRQILDTGGCSLRLLREGAPRGCSLGFPGSCIPEQGTESCTRMCEWWQNGNGLLREKHFRRQKQGWRKVGGSVVDGVPGSSHPSVLCSGAI